MFETVCPSYCSRSDSGCGCGKVLRLKKSAAVFDLPVLYLISKLYCCKRILHLANLPVADLMSFNHLRDMWSAYTIKCRFARYTLCSFVASITANAFRWVMARLPCYLLTLYPNKKRHVPYHIPQPDLG